MGRVPQWHKIGISSAHSEAWKRIWGYKIKNCLETNPAWVRRKIETCEYAYAQAHRDIQLYGAFTTPNSSGYIPRLALRFTLPILARNVTYKPKKIAFLSCSHINIIWVYIIIGKQKQCTRAWKSINHLSSRNIKIPSQFHSLYIFKKIHIGTAVFIVRIIPVSKLSPQLHYFNAIRAKCTNIESYILNRRIHSLSYF